MSLIKDAELTKCSICEAPYRRPLSPGWTAVSYRVGTKQYVQVHRPDCPAGGRPRGKESDAS